MKKWKNEKMNKWMICISIDGISAPPEAWAAVLPRTPVVPELPVSATYGAKTASK